MNSQRNAPTRRALLFQRLRSRIAGAIPKVPANVLQLPILGIAVGVTASLVVASFKAIIAFAGLSLVGLHSEDFESLPTVATALLPLTGAVVIGVLLTRMAAEDRRTGIAHVLERLGSHQGRLPVKNALVQFFAGAGALAVGLSGGREGPAIHLGAATSSILGQAFKLPNHRIRLLVACGAAAATAASFHTPVAAIVFAMEVVLMEWAIGCLIPVILAVAAATVVSRIVFLPAPDLVVPQMGSPSMLDLVYMAFGGFAIGAIAAGFILAVRSGVALPAMLIVVIATWTTRRVFRQRSVFLTMLAALGLERLPSEHLLRAPVGSIMERSIVRLPDVMNVRAAADALAGNPEWVVVENGDGNVRCLLKAGDLARHLRTTSEKEVHLMLLSAEPKDALGIDIDATLRDAQDVFTRSGVEALYVRRTASGTAMIGGVLTRAAINAHTRTATRPGHG